MDSIRIYDAGPAVFDYSRKDHSGNRSCNVVRDEHLVTLSRVKEQLVSRLHGCKIELIFPTDNIANIGLETIGISSERSSAIANSCEADILSCDIILADVSPWPKSSIQNPIESPMADEGTVYEVGFAMGIIDMMENLRRKLGPENPAMEDLNCLHKPKAVVPYNTASTTIETRMQVHYGGRYYEDSGNIFSTEDHTLIENFGDKNNAMISNIYRKQGIEPQASFESALRTGLTLIL